ncbi:sugar O-acetyltransferase [Clostridium paraputrificum]|uniref:sugar O-acetyltransferase n=1 Tax=Clostridium paraputrificum TaxID=29363 RepID=UPI003D33330C
MKEKEKMLNGEFYNTRDEELQNRYHKTKELLDRFNNSNSRDKELKEKLLKELLGRCGKGVWIEKNFSCDYGENIYIGDDTFINYNCVLLDDNNITIGKNSLIGPNTQIYTAMHPVNPRERLNKENPIQSPYKTCSNAVFIGDNVWIGGSVCILPGVTIGDNCVIGAGSVVTKSIPKDSVAVGNPCRIIRSVYEK